MSGKMQSHVFWGGSSPLASLSGGGLLLMASDRLAHALVAGGALLWVCCFTALAAFPSVKIFPSRGRHFILIFMAAFLCSLYLLLLWVISPFSALEAFFIIPLIPLFCAASGFFSRIELPALGDCLYRAASEALVMAALIIAFSLIREPLGFACLSLPGGSRGLVYIFSFGGESFLPLRIISCSAGALLLLGYGIGIYRRNRNIRMPGEAD